MIKRDMTFVDI